VREQRERLEREREYDYWHDPYFYTPPSYRYSRGGRYYETNEYGARVLERAVQFGYDEGFRAGEADREDGWKPSYRDSYAYRDADYGYEGRYVDPDDYRHYFREGFRRGYDDGYQSAQRYGSYADGKYSILGEVLASILNLQTE
jgi:flagellar biosynthesis/type III secretory pathway protein FliH